MLGSNPTWVLTIASLKMWFRDPQAIFWTFFLPLVLMVIFGILNFGDFGAVDLGVVDRSQNAASRSLAGSLEETGAFSLSMGSTEREQRLALSDGERDLVLIIPPGFGQAAGGCILGPVHHAQVNRAKVAKI